MSGTPAEAPGGDPGASVERTSLAWNRTGLSAAAVGALTLHVFFDRGVAALALTALLGGGGAIAYLSARHSPVSPARLRLLSLVITAAAVLGAWLSVTQA